MVGSLTHARSQIHHNVLEVYLYPGSIVALGALNMPKVPANERECSQRTNHRARM